MNTPTPERTEKEDGGAQVLRGLEYCMNWKNEKPDAVRFATAMADARQYIIDCRAQNEALRGALVEITERTRMVLDQTNGHWDTSKPSHMRLIRVLEGNISLAQPLLNSTPPAKA